MPIPSKNLIAQLKKDEGFYAKPYLCTEKACTIGYGTNLEAHPKYIPFPGVRELVQCGRMNGAALKNALLQRGMKWTREKAEAAMLEELCQCRDNLDKRCPQFRRLIENGETARAEVLLNMAFNMGVAGVLGFRNTLSMLDEAISGQRSYADVGRGMLNSKWARQVKGRARRLARQMETGVYQ